MCVETVDGGELKIKRENVNTHGKLNVECLFLT